MCSPAPPALPLFEPFWYRDALCCPWSCVRENGLLYSTPSRKAQDVLLRLHVQQWVWCDLKGMETSELLYPKEDIWWFYRRRIKASFFLPTKQLLSIQYLLERCWRGSTWGFLLSTPFVTDILQSPVGDAKRNTRHLGFQDHDPKGTLPQIDIQKWTEEKVKPAFHWSQ